MSVGFDDSEKCLEMVKKILGAGWNIDGDPSGKRFVLSNTSPEQKIFSTLEECAAYVEGCEDTAEE